jgi:polysaccharide export outer membrane protein
MRKLIIIVVFLSLSLSTFSQEKISYVITRGDILDVAVMQHPEFSIGGLIVLPDGYIQYPGLGSIKVAGMTVQNFTDSITVAMRRFVVNPIVTVFVKRIQAQHLNVFGFVNRPGQFQLFEEVDLFAAIGLAGGLKSFKKVKNIVIIRENREVEEYKIRDFFRTGDIDIDVPIVRAGDTVYIVEPREFNWSRLSFITTLTYTVIMIINILTR